MFSTSQVYPNCHISATVHDFSERFTESTRHNAAVKAILLQEVPHAYNVTPAAKVDDKAGVDVWCFRDSGLRPIGIDVKIRGRDYGKDVCLEVYSDIDAQRPGWTLDKGKKTDAVLYYWPTNRRFLIIGYSQLRDTFSRYWKSWQYHYETAKVKSSGWHDKWQAFCIMVKETDLRAALPSGTFWQAGTLTEGGEL